MLIHSSLNAKTCVLFDWSEAHYFLDEWYLLCFVLLQRHRDKIAHLMSTLRSIIPSSERQEMSSVLAGAIKHIHHLREENEVRALHGCHGVKPPHSTHTRCAD